MKKIKEIYLTAGDEDESLVWCEDKVTDEDVKYIRADILESSLLSQKKQIIEMVEGLVTYEEWIDGKNTKWVNLEDILENLKQ